MTYDADNRLLTVNSVGVTNDLDGNLTYAPLASGSFTNYTYDARNRLLNAGGVTNTYDAINNRIGQAVGTTNTAYVVNPNAKLPQVLMRIKNGMTNYYIYGAGLLYQITATGTNTSTLTYHYDYRGSTIALSADSGLVTDRIEYSAYGLTTYRAGTNDTPFLYNGRFGVQTDPNGLLYMQARYYNPYLCRFINPDPSGFKGGLNFYAYANGNPVSYLDPFGLCADATGDTSLYYNQLFGIPPGQLTLTQSAELIAAGIDYNPYVDQPKEPSTLSLMTLGFGFMAPGLIAAEETASITTPYAVEAQSSSAEAQAALAQAQNGATLYRTGQLGTSMTGESQYWSLQNPLLNPNYASEMGMPGGTTDGNQ
jgi:RHS repeat-associated protein